MQREATNYARGRSGRPLQRLKAMMKREGSNICWQCGKPIDLALPYNHKWAWTLDHYIPLSKGGGALDPANCREAHRTCNSQRGNRDQGPSSSTVRDW